MAYRVSITPRAERDLAALYDRIDAKSFAAASRWYAQLKAAILSLDEHPERCPATPEHKQLRHLLHGNKPHVYRVIYRVLKQRREVEVLHIRHAARQVFRTPETGEGFTLNTR